MPNSKSNYSQQAWHEVVYNASILLCVGDGEAHEESMDRLGFTVSTKAKAGLMSPIERDEDGARLWVIWFPKKTTSLDVVVHECFHVASSILRSRGILLSEETEEAYAYFLDFIFAEVRRRMKNDTKGQVIA